MEESNVPPVTKVTIYDAVHQFGARAWRGNSEEKRQGYIRMLVPPYDLITGNISWTDYRKTLRADHAPEAPLPTNVAFCALGDSRVIL
jgi:hypothetical protein